MKRIYITFGGRGYDETTKKIVEGAPRFGADQVLVYDDRWLMDQEFYGLNQWLWQHRGDRNGNKRGFGWFAWKPFILMHALSQCEPGDVVLYTDADTYPIRDISVLYDECARNGGAMFFSAVGCDHSNWCKRDCFIVMGQDSKPWTDHLQHGVARFMLIQKGPWKPYQMLCEWLTYCLNPLAQTFDPSVLAPEYADLHEHRTEQAIMSNLCHKYGFKLYREACQFGATQPEDQELYPQLFEQVWAGSPKTLEGSRYRNV